MNKLVKKTPTIEKTLKKTQQLYQLLNSFDLPYNYILEQERQESRFEDTDLVIVVFKNKKTVGTLHITNLESHYEFRVNGFLMRKYVQIKYNNNHLLHYINKKLKDYVVNYMLGRLDKEK